MYNFVKRNFILKSVLVKKKKENKGMNLKLNKKKTICARVGFD